MTDGLSAFFSLVLAIIGMALVLYLCYRFSKYLSSHYSKISSSANIKIVERAILAQDRGLAIAEVCSKYYLIGYSGNSVEILKELEDYDPALVRTFAEQNDFVNILKDTVKKQAEKMQSKIKLGGKGKDE